MFNRPINTFSKIIKFKYIKKMKEPLDLTSRKLYEYVLYSLLYYVYYFDNLQENAIFQVITKNCNTSEFNRKSVIELGMPTILILFCKYNFLIHNKMLDVVYLEYYCPFVAQM